MNTSFRQFASVNNTDTLGSMTVRLTSNDYVYVGVGNARVRVYISTAEDHIKEETLW